MNNFLDRLENKTIFLCDGGMGTALQARGLPAGACPEEYNVSHPEIVQSIYADYFAAGSDIVETNTFGGNRSRLILHGFDKRVIEFCRKSTVLAKEVCPKGKFVAGSIGPTGDILEPFGPRLFAEARAIFAEQALALAEGGVDVLFVETMMAAEEAELAIAAAKSETNLPVVATMTFEAGKAGLRTMWGVDVQTAVMKLTTAGADVIGSNCGKGFDEMIAIVREMRPFTDKPIIAQPNAGIPELIDGQPVYRETPEQIKPKILELLQAGVNILGGCCGTTPEHIRMMREQVDAFCLDTH